jgi:protein-S-isoprenylcysteine O-methyltransferase Ste14
MTRFATAFVWLGGAMFVGSLAATAYTFAVVWSRADLAARPVSWAAAGVDAAVFSIFAAHHSAFARPRVKAAVARVVPESLIRSVYVWTASLLLVGVLLAWRPVGGELYDVRGPSAWLLLAMQLAGLWLVAASVRAIDGLELAGIAPPSRESGLQLHGPYGLVRHPLYLGWILITFGAAHMTGDRFAFAAITTSYLVLAIPWEERSLERAFGDAYRRYKNQVRWRVVPFVY